MIDLEKSANISISRNFLEPIDNETIDWVVEKMKIMYDCFKPKLDDLNLK